VTSLGDIPAVTGHAASDSTTRTKIHPAERDEELGYWIVVETRTKGGVLAVRGWRTGADGKPECSLWLDPSGQPIDSLNRPQQPARGARRGRSRIERFNDHYPVSGLLQRFHGLHAVPGRSVRCVWHDDKRPSLSVMRDDRRVYCHSPSCWAHNGGQGRDAWDIAGQADEVRS